MILGRENQSFTYNLVLSVTTHVLVIIFLFAFSRWVLDQGKVMIDSNQLKALQSAVRVDVVGMPILTKKELENLVDLSSPKKEVVSDKTIKESGGKAEKVEIDKEIKSNEPVQYVKADESKQRNNFLSLVKGLGKKDLPVKNDAKSESEEGRDIQLAGNKLSQGSATTGTVTSDQLDAVTLYLDSVRARLKMFWKLPSYLKDKNLTCRALLLIGPSGELIKVSIHQSSGAFDYDDKVIETVNRAAPFASPPEEIKVKLATGGIVFGFPL